MWSRDEETGEEGWKPVVELFVTPEKALLELRLEAEDGVTEVLRVTPEHPLWSLDDGGWEEAGELEFGEWVDALDGRVRLVGAESLAEPATVYNFEVADSHTSFVGETGVWAHNVCKSLSEAWQALKE